ncbi:YihY/virulence factor BrkB family protein [Pelagibacterium montanilacus]|uniref:YihY/virulence factor BrkB family protein n=1 Tax=Pelagibacterium montanilacus TaxID=2185280 RepID=UPI0013DE96EA|nr:YihY/virulence factor BrkB family protein [Pelagibacterium montanilacus]
METTLRCAGVAYFIFLSLFPAIGIGVFLFGLFASRQFVAEQLDRVSMFLPEIALGVLRERLDLLLDQPQAGLGIGLAVSLVIALWSGSRGMDALIYATSAANHEDNQRSFLVSVLLSIVVTLIGTIFLLLALSIIAALPAIAGLSPIPGTQERITMILRWPLLLALAMVGITALYYTANRRPPKLKWIWPGALLASVLWLASCFVFSLYVEKIGDFEATFGSLTAAVVLLLWLYLSALIFILGASLNAEIEFQTAKDSTMGQPRPRGARGAVVADERPD